MIYAVCMIFAKTAILLEWTHIFVPDRQRNAFYWGARGIMALNIALYLAVIITETMSCIPLKVIWTPWLEGDCRVNKKVLDIITAYFNLVVDLIILLLPQRVIWKLSMTGSKKIGVSVIFSIGILTIVCAIGRVYANHQLQYVGHDGGVVDTNYGLAALYLWAVSELTCVLLVFSMDCQNL
ncbi:hypothetical protein B0T17DRAFT_545794 [Bombardia bombarda]|uniref:Rhodopsin domain-containing protein n=1 Tax=Bombardia bombarda TaxID=252184 RepID=A0AA39T0U7_9PEZI|nr:hypothetical protein B0T17DRAFT_545794 [Bombardia bombarda]